MSEQRKAFTFKDKQLGKAKKSWSSCNNDMEFTAWLLEGLAQLEVTMVAKLLRENTEVQRLWTPKTYFDQGEEYMLPPQLNNTTRATAVARFILEKSKKMVNKCQQCKHPNHKGPADDCCVPENNTTAGACLNCYYHGQGANCSFRKEAKKVEEEKLVKKQKQAFKMYTPDQLDNMSLDTLKEMEMMIHEAMDEKRVGESPIKRRRN